MEKTVQLVLDLVSPNGYLMWWPLRDLVRREGAGFDVVPVFLGGMHKLTGNAPPFMRDADVRGKNEYAALEFDRFVRRHELARFRMNPAFPFNSILLQRMLYAADQDGRGVYFAELMLKAVWEDGLDVADADAVGAAIAAGDFDADDLLARAGTDAVKQGLADNTAQAVERGAFGIPTVFIGEEMFFGKERLGQIEEALIG